jgi:hypothetical protein
MDAGEPRMRHRGFFLHSDTTGEAEAGEQENPEGFVVRVRITRPSVPRQVSSASIRTMAAGRSRIRVRAADESDPQIRSGSATGSRQRSH